MGSENTRVMPLQKPMSYGYIDFNNNVWPASSVNVYNLYTKDINKSAGIPIKPGSLTEKERDLWLSRRHLYFTDTALFLDNINKG